jgi:DUF3054 family protein
MRARAYHRHMRILQLPHRTAVASDVLALVAFVTIGLVNHHGGISAAGYARDAVPILACWLVAGGALDLYRRPRAGALLGTWLAGVGGGIAIRALTLWRFDDDDVVFLGVALGFTLLFVVALRAVAAFAAPRLA